jgi:indole-3-glycerol phosphate synthase
MPDVLGAIVGATRRIVEIRREQVAASELERRAAGARAHAGFAEALRGGSGPRIIAECKRRSPSRGVLRASYDPAAIAARYELAGAAAVSVLTEPTFFDGAPEHLTAVRRAVRLPVLRKDFIVDEYQLLEARAWGADAVLLIVAALSDAELRTLARRAAAMRLDVLVEVHDRAELDRALEAGARLVGVNNRNLRTLGVDRDASVRLIEHVPHDVVAVAESGLQSRTDIDRLGSLGYRAFLVGERLMTMPDPGAALRELVGA